MSNLDWTKYGKVDTKNRRVAVPVSNEMEKLMDIFRQAYPDRRFSDTKIIGTFVEAGARLWVTQNFSNQNNTPVQQED